MGRTEGISLHIFFLLAKCVVMFYPILFSCDECFLHRYSGLLGYAPIHHMMASHSLTCDSTMNRAAIKAF